MPGCSLRTTVVMGRVLTLLLTSLASFSPVKWGEEQSPEAIPRHWHYQLGPLHHMWLIRILCHESAIAKLISEGALTSLGPVFTARHPQIQRHSDNLTRPHLSDVHDSQTHTNLSSCSSPTSHRQCHPEGSGLVKGGGPRTQPGLPWRAGI